MIRLTSPSEGIERPDLTPLIDIVFIVIVFLLLTMNVQLLSLPIELPETESAIPQASPEPHSVRLRLQAAAPYWVIEAASRATDTEWETLERPLSFDQWETFKPALLRAIRQPQTQLLIAPESDVSAESLLQLLALLNEHDFADAQVLMQPAVAAP